MSPSDPTPVRRRTANPRGDQIIRAVPTSRVDDLPRPRMHSSLTRGIVWADISAEIAAEEDARDLPDAA